MKGDVEAILGKAPPPSKLRGPSEEGAEAEGDDYDAARDSMAAFIAAVKSGDEMAALEAYEDVKANC